MKTEPNTSDPVAMARALGEFIDASPTPFHATRTLSKLLIDAGFERLDENERWALKDDGKYFVTRNDSSILAFTHPGQVANGIRMSGAHTDSPCLKIKPNASLTRHNVWQLGVEVYGGALLHPWFDRDLSIAGRVSGTLRSGEPFSELIDFKRPIARIPSLAIHLAREVNNSNPINAQKHLPLMLGDINNKSSFEALLIELCEADAEAILEYELSCYDTQASTITGLNKEWISASRLDNLLSCFIAARALIDATVKPNQTALFVATDHEEIGSASTCGAQGPFLKSVLERLTPDAQALTQCMQRSLLVSCDNAHAIHPNYADKHDEQHGPKINQGPVIKINTNQRYATNSESSTAFQMVCKAANVPVQKFVVRSDMGCGSTIGPIMATELGIPTLDIGAPQWAMHSIRETAGTKDCEYLHQALTTFYSQ